MSHQAVQSAWQAGKPPQLYVGHWNVIELFSLKENVFILAMLMAYFADKGFELLSKSSQTCIVCIFLCIQYFSLMLSTSVAEM